MWREGSKLVHPFNPELGVGLVRTIEGRFLVVYFPGADREVTLAAENSGLEPFIMPPGASAVLLETDEEVEVGAYDAGSYTLEDGRVVDDANLWPLDAADGPLERLARQDLDRAGSFRNRIEGMRLTELREAGGLGSFLGGRIELFPHQLHTALTASKMERVRWLLADEVGLGKTIVACLILSALVRTGRAERALIIAPSTLTVQWLGELYRKFHQVFVMIDPERVESVEKVYGAGNNPFDVHPYAVISSDLLASDPELARGALDADLDLVVVDEAHRLANPELYASVAPLVEHARHALLLTATPLAADQEGFFRLLSLLHPEAYSDLASFEAALEAGEAVFPCTSAVRRDDLGGLPPRRPIAIDVGPAMKEPRRDPRAAWIAERAHAWLEAGEKALVFVRELRTLERLKKFLESTANVRISVFHEELSEAQRDIEVARFRESSLPILLCTEAGGEGRNFQFCDRMVHYDLPADPAQLEQRIGRLDRIGRESDVEIVYFRCAKARPDLARLFERLDLFGRPSAGLDPALDAITPAVHEADAAGRAIDVEALAGQVEEAQTRGVRDLPRVLYRDAYDASRADELLALVPDELEKCMRRFVLGAANDLGLKIVEKGGEALYYLELGTSLTVETIPGVADDSRWLGTFSRAEAIEKDELEFYASGHALVEGLLLELADGRRGRSAAFEVAHESLRGMGMLCAFRADGGWKPVVVDARGEHRPDLVEPLLEVLGDARGARPEDWGLGERWAQGVETLAARAWEHAPPDARLEAVGFFRLVPPPGGNGAAS